MKLDDLCAALDSTGLQWRRVQWDPDDPDRPRLPYIMLVPQASSDVIADGAVFSKATDYDVELYERGSSLETEALVEGAIDALDAAYTRRTVTGVADGVVEVVWSLCVTDR